MDIGKIVFEEFNQWVYNDVNQAGDAMQVVDAADLPQIIQNVVEKYNDIHNVEGQSEQLKAFNTWFQKNGQLYEWGIDESVLDDYLKSL